jgi:hypothetical protein
MLKIPYYQQVQTSDLKNLWCTSSTIFSYMETLTYEVFSECIVIQKIK